MLLNKLLEPKLKGKLELTKNMIKFDWAYVDNNKAYEFITQISLNLICFTHRQYRMYFTLQLYCFMLLYNNSVENCIYYCYYPDTTQIWGFYSLPFLRKFGLLSLQAVLQNSVSNPFLSFSKLSNWHLFAIALQRSWNACRPRKLAIFSISRRLSWNTFLSSPHLCFIIVCICDLFVSRDDPLMS